MSDEKATKADPKTDPKPATEDKPPRPEAPAPQTVKAGRIVSYVTTSGTTRPAIVTRVNTDDGDVDLTVFNSEGAVPVVNVEHSQEDWEPGSWHWPPRD